MPSHTLKKTRIPRENVSSSAFEFTLLEHIRRDVIDIAERRLENVPNDHAENHHLIVTKGCFMLQELKSRLSLVNVIRKRLEERPQIIVALPDVEMDCVSLKYRCVYPFLDDEFKRKQRTINETVLIDIRLALSELCLFAGHLQTFINLQETDPFRFVLYVSFYDNSSIIQPDNKRFV